MKDVLKTYSCEACSNEFIIRNPPIDKEIWSCPWCCVTGVWLNNQKQGIKVSGVPYRVTIKEAEK